MKLINQGTLIFRSVEKYCDKEFLVKKHREYERKICGARSEKIFVEWPRTAQMALKFLFFSEIFLSMLGTMAVRCQQDLLFSSQTCCVFELDLPCFDSEFPCL